ncbi:unnamed protein product [Thlaspi arvense]|uniref:Uncharacterized protein n=1 Tax=Thlaspi arvense TaxID=13288 RepID=A0AAU9SSJ2_THLAR|nr:unnamed protein product [Thlaspi arvense]
MLHLLLPNNKPNKRNNFFLFSIPIFFMESSMNNAFIMSKHETTTFSSDQTPEESSWTMYFEDFFEASSSVVDVGDCSYSSVSDAMSFVATKKTLHVSNQEEFNSSNKFDIKRTNNREIPFGRHYDLEDTASSPSRSPNVYSMMNLLDNNTRHGNGVVGVDTNNVKGERAVQNQGGLSVDLKKKGLCLVPMSMVTNFLG